MIEDAEFNYIDAINSDDFTRIRNCEVSIDRISPHKEKSVTFLTKKNLFVWNDDELLR